MIESIKIAINRTIAFIESNGYRVIFNKSVKESLCDPENKEIHLVDRGQHRYKLYVLFHEAGHMLLFEQGNYLESFGARCEQYHRSYRKKTNLAKYHELKEEVLAWEKGIEIANRLNIIINKRDYDNYAARCYMTYVKAVNKSPLVDNIKEYE